MKVLDKPSMQTFEEIESEVRSYCRQFDKLFVRAKDATVWDIEGKEYIDFFAGAGALNYGHNNPRMKQKLLNYMMNDGVTHSLDMATVAKERFLRRFKDVILRPRGLDYKVMFPGPTGTNAVESAFKIARKVTGRETIMSFTNAFHGMTIGSLSATGNRFKRDGAGMPLMNTVFMPYDKYLGENFNSIEYIDKLLNDKGSGIPLPAAAIVETVQGEGGLNAASYEWLRQLEQLCRHYGILLIVDDIQMGCGRTGPFFSFERAQIKPDIVCLSKSIGGYGLPFALTLFRPELDVWSPGEHNGTFRGNNLAFIASEASLTYWEDDELTNEVDKKARIVHDFLNKIVNKYPALKGEVRGRGLIQGIACHEEEMAGKICNIAFGKGLIMETSGARDEVFKIMPPLTIPQELLEKGLDMIESSICEAL
jgi:diaminobutyrate-2-oxoglutarate transaminase